MAAAKTNAEWSSLMVQPSVVKAVSKLLEKYDACKSRTSPIEFLEKVFQADDRDGSIGPPRSAPADNKEKGARGRWRRSKAQTHTKTETAGEDLHRADSLLLDDMTDAKCEYPEVCKLLDSTHVDPRVLYTKYEDPALGECDDSSSADSSADTKMSMQCQCPSDEGSTSCVFTTASTRSSYSEQALDETRKSSSDILDSYSQYQEEDERGRAPRCKAPGQGQGACKAADSAGCVRGKPASRRTTSPDFTSLSASHLTDASTENLKKNLKDTYSHNLPKDISSKLEMMSKSQPRGESGAKEALIKGVRSDDDYKQAIIKLFLQIVDNDMFVQTILSQFGSARNHHVPSGFLRVITYLIFFNLNTGNLEDIKKLILHSYPRKLLELFKFITSDEFQRCVKLLLKHYDKTFVKERAKHQAGKKLVGKLRDEIAEFVERQEEAAAQKQEAEGDKKRLTSQQQQDKQRDAVMKVDFHAKPTPASTYVAPKNCYLKREADNRAKLWGDERRRKKKEDEVGAKDVQEVPKKVEKMDPFCSGCMERDSLQSRRRHMPKPEFKIPLKSDEDPCAPQRPFEVQLLAYRAGATTTGRDPIGRPRANDPAFPAVSPRALISARHEDCFPPARYRRLSKPPPNFEKVAIPVKMTAATVLREGARLKQDEQRALDKLERLAAGGGNWMAVEELQARIREEAAQEELEALERKHLQGLITREEALIARQQMLQRQRDNAMAMREEKEMLDRQLVEFQRAEEAKIREQVHRIHDIQMAAKEKTEELKKQKSEEVQNFIRERREILAEMQKQRQEELEQRIALIREVRALQGLAKQRKKEIDFTITPGYGLFYEMSIAELHERLNLLREELREELEEKRQRAQQFRQQQKQRVQQTMEYIYRQKQNRAPDFPPMVERRKSKEESEEIQMLRQRLMEARLQRLGQY